MSVGLNYFSIAASSSAAGSGGTAGSGLVAVINASATAQTYGLKLVDAPSYAAYNANPSAYNLLFIATEGAGQFLDTTFLNKPIQVTYGIVAVPLGAANSDGGWTILYL